MTFEEAMDLVRHGGKKTRVSRPGLPGKGLTWRFGDVVVIMKGRWYLASQDDFAQYRESSFISYTPTDEDMAADDWYAWQVK